MTLFSFLYSHLNIIIISLSTIASLSIIPPSLATSPRGSDDLPPIIFVRSALESCDSQSVEKSFWVRPGHSNGVEPDYTQLRSDGVTTINASLATYPQPYGSISECRDGVVTINTNQAGRAVEEFSLYKMGRLNWRWLQTKIT